MCGEGPDTWQVLLHAEQRGEGRGAKDLPAAAGSQQP